MVQQKLINPKPLNPKPLKCNDSVMQSPILGYLSSYHHFRSGALKSKMWLHFATALRTHVSIIYLGHKACFKATEIGTWILSAVLIEGPD